MMILRKTIYEMFRTAVKLEDKVIDLAYEMGDLEGLSAADVKQYIRYLADRRLLQLGLKTNWKVKENPLPWMEELLGAVVAFLISLRSVSQTTTHMD
jgi:ribonucleoside-diphosphate reductase beta chain